LWYRTSKSRNARARYWHLLTYPFWKCLPLVYKVGIVKRVIFILFFVTARAVGTKNPNSVYKALFEAARVIFVLAAV
jgi:hypothetical protein